MIIILDLKILSFELGPVRYSGEQFFAALRLVIHAEGGDGVDRGLAFVQSSFFSFLLFVVSIVYCGRLSACVHLFTSYLSCHIISC